jgi:two-component system chemotaxis response regulator CheB
VARIKTNDGTAAASDTLSRSNLSQPDRRNGDNKPLGYHIVVVGGSAGALDPFLKIAAGLPAEFPHSVFIVSHVGANPSQLPDLLRSSGRLPATHPRDDESIRPGHIYVAPPDYHMLISGDHIRLSHGPREHFTRPAIDPLFRSAARHHGAAVIGVVLSGTGSDGAVGLEAIRRAGGRTMIQAPADALFPDMPRSAMAALPVDHIVAATDLAPTLIKITATSPPGLGVKESGRDMETDIERPAGFTCPECGGVLRELPDTPIKTYRCHTGHRFAADELLSKQINDVEHAVFAAVRVLNEQAELCRKMIDDARKAGRTHGVAYWSRLKLEAETQLQTLQRFLLRDRATETAED